MPITTKMDNKVVASTQVSRPRPEIQSNALNADLARNPSASNGNAPPVQPACQSDWGMADRGNGPKIPTHPLGHRRP
jgi:hypothetical protein